MTKVLSTLIAISLGAMVASAQTVNYAYDAGGRLIRADYGDAGAIAYTYDAAGNLIGRAITSGATQTFASVSSASFAANADLAPEVIAAGFGADLATGVAVATTVPLPTGLLGTTVTVTDSGGTARPAQLFFVSPGQINYLIPAGTALGTATVNVESGAGASATGTVEIAGVAPALYAANAQGNGVAAAFFLRVAADGTRTQELLFDPATGAAIPVDLGPEGDQVFLLLFGTGVRGFQDAVGAQVGGQDVPVLGAVPQPEFVGLDQINIGPLPRSLPSGESAIILTADGQSTNQLSVTVQ